MKLSAPGRCDRVACQGIAGNKSASWRASMKIGSVTFTPVQIGITILTWITAVIHLTLGQPMFILNGLGYLALWAALYLPIKFLQPWHRLIHWAFIGYTLLTIILYFVFHADGSWQSDGLGMFTKVVEVILLLLLIYDAMSSRAEEPGSPQF
jgi:hypothetical protein